MQKKCLLLCKNFKHLSLTQQSIVEMRLRNAVKGINQRTFSEEEKNMALAIYKRSPSAYRFLTGIFILPAISTARKNSTKIDLDTGLNTYIFKLLQKYSFTMKDSRDKVVILIWDETHLKTEVHYDYKKDKMVGFEDYGNRRTSKFANKMLVFMIRGLWSNTKFPISYYFTNAETAHTDLVHLIRENFTMLQNAGFTVVATVCAATSPNNKALEYLRANYIIECRQKNIEPGNLNALKATRLN